MPNENPNYYEVLECVKEASFEDLKKSYQRLVLASHPDKVTDREAQSNFHLVQKAWNVLRDPVTRKQYDAKLSCQDHSEILLYNTIYVKDMSLNAEDNCYCYTCRCGGTYRLEVSGIIGSEVVIDCDECSFSIKVLFESSEYMNYFHFCC